MQTLEQLNYKVRQFLLSPLQIGVPNERVRYYLVAVWQGLKGDSAAASMQQEEQVQVDDNNNNTNLTIETTFPANYDFKISDELQTLRPYLLDNGQYEDLIAQEAIVQQQLQQLKKAKSSNNSKNKSKSNKQKQLQQKTQQQKQQGEAHQPAVENAEEAEEQDDDSSASLTIPSKCFFKHKGYRYDIVTQDSKSSSCFTKGYGLTRFVRGTGPLLRPLQEQQQVEQEQQQEQQNQDDKATASTCEYDWNDPNALAKLNLRWFHPYEIAAVMGFPMKHVSHGMTMQNKEEQQQQPNKKYYEIPVTNGKVTCRQSMESLGNSINVTVVSRLMQFMFETKLQ